MTAPYASLVIDGRQLHRRAVPQVRIRDRHLLEHAVLPAPLRAREPVAVLAADPLEQRGPLGHVAVLRRVHGGAGAEVVERYDHRGRRLGLAGAELSVVGVEVDLGGWVGVLSESQLVAVSPAAETLLAVVHPVGGRYLGDDDPAQTAILQMEGRNYIR